MDEFEYRVGDYGSGVGLFYVQKGSGKELSKDMVAFKKDNSQVRLMGNYLSWRDAEAVKQFEQLPVDAE